MVGCSALGCKSRSERKIPGLKFYSFPKDPELKQQWIAATGRLNWTPPRYARLCSVHDIVMMKDSPASSLKKKRYKDMSNVDAAILPKNEIEDVDEYNAIKCRVCLVAIVDLRKISNLFDTWNPPWDGMEPTIAEDLMKSTHINVQQNDSFSQVICCDCVVKLRQVCMFIQLAQNTDKILRWSVGNTAADISSLWPKPIQLDKTVSATVTTPIYDAFSVRIKEEVISEDDYGADTKWTDEYSDGVDIKIEPEELVLQQPFQGPLNGMSQGYEFSETKKVFNGAHNLPEDLAVAVKEEPSDEDSSFNDLPLNCLLCTKTLNTISGLKAHVIAQHSYKSVKRKTDNSSSPERLVPKYACSTCDGCFVTPTDLRVHEARHKELVCYSCNEQFDTFKKLTKHRKSCKVSSRSGNSLLKLVTLDDLRRTRAQDVYKCTQCNETFTQNYYLRIHKEVQHYTEQYEALESDANEDVTDTLMDV